MTSLFLSLCPLEEFSTQWILEQKDTLAMTNKTNHISIHLPKYEVRPWLFFSLNDHRASFDV